jgi:caa(3)-type oxidase subunit IV
MTIAEKSNGMRGTFIVYGAILTIAVLQVAVALIAGPSLVRMLILAVVQAYLAVMFFMHLRDEKRNLQLALVPATIFVLLMMNMIWRDAFRVHTFLTR